MVLGVAWQERPNTNVLMGAMRATLVDVQIPQIADGSVRGRTLDFCHGSLQIFFGAMWVVFVSAASQHAVYGARAGLVKFQGASRKFNSRLHFHARDDSDDS